MTDNHIETALRTAMERRAAKVPSLPDDFAEQVINKMNVRKKLRHRRFAAVLSIAAVLLIAFLLLRPLSDSPRGGEDSLSSGKKDNIGLAALPPTGGAGRGAEVQPTPQPVKKCRQAVGKQGTPVEPVQEGLELSSESLPNQKESPQPSNGEEINIMKACYDEVDSRTQLYTAEIELEQSTHQRQKAYEKEMQQRGLELLLFLMTDKEEVLPDGTVKTQKS